MKNNFLIFLLKTANLFLHFITLGIPKLVAVINKKIVKLEATNQGE